MWFYKCFSFGYLIFLVLVFCVDMKHQKNNKKPLNEELKIFKNITEANKTLQDLIKNIHQLEKIYKNDETSASDSSESEIDEAFRQISYDNKHKDKHFRKQTFTTNDPSYNYRGTAYIYEYQESALGDEDGKDEKEKLVNATEEKTAEEVSIENNVETKTSSERISSSDEIEPKTESDEVVEIKIDSKQKHKSLAIKKPKLSLIYNKPQSYHNNPDKKRFSVLHSSKDNINVKSNSPKIPFKFGNHRIVYSEQFPPETIWDEIINRPIKLNRVLSSKETSASASNSGENEKKTAIEKTDKIEKEDNTKGLGDLQTQEGLSNFATDEDPIIRSGYVDDCIRIPIKKCKKALKAVNKNVCKRRFKCESDFRSDFEENSNKECVKKFSYTLSVRKESNYNVSRGKKGRKGDNQLLDANRYRHPHPDLSQRHRGQNRSIPLSLRDKYEKKCQKESREKCITACNDATENTCLKYTCDKKRNKALTKACKEECKNTFVIDNNKKSSESSDDSSNSDSDSN